MIIESIMNVVLSYLQQVEPTKEHSIRVSTSHKKIYKAIEERNLTSAEKEMEKHFFDVNSQLLSLLGSSNSNL
jgi:DNA-binding FadR family transcriptional regulator